MRKMRLAAMALLALACAGKAQADPITYTWTATVSVTVAGHTTNPEAVTITATGDTTGVGYSGAQTSYFNVPVSVTLSGADIGTLRLTDAFDVYDAQASSPGTLGLYDVYTAGVVISVNNSAFNHYALASNIGPITDSTVATNAGTNMASNRGTVVFNSVSSTATVSAAVPEPSSIVLTGLAGVVALGYFRTRARLAPKRS